MISDSEIEEDQLFDQVYSYLVSNRVKKALINEGTDNSLSDPHMAAGNTLHKSVVLL